MECAFDHPNYELDANGILIRKSDAGSLTSSDARNAEEASVIEAIAEYVQAKMRCVYNSTRCIALTERSMGLIEHWIPDPDDEARCSIFMSHLDTSNKLLMILQNQVVAWCLKVSH